VQDFAHAVEAVRRAYEQAGMVVVVARQADAFARLQVTDQDSDQVAMVDLAADFREREPVQLSIGPVLAERDAVAAKTAATFSRGEARDYLDLAGILASGHYSQEELIAPAAQSDAGFDRAIFAEALAGVDRFPDREFVATGPRLGRSLGFARPCVAGAEGWRKRQTVRRRPRLVVNLLASLAHLRMLTLPGSVPIRAAHIAGCQGPAAMGMAAMWASTGRLLQAQGVNGARPQFDEPCR